MQIHFGNEKLCVFSRSSILHLGKSGLPSKAMTNDDADRLFLCLRVLSDTTPEVVTVFNENCREALSIMLAANALQESTIQKVSVIRVGIAAEKRTRGNWTGGFRAWGTARALLVSSRRPKLRKQSTELYAEFDRTATNSDAQVLSVADGIWANLIGRTLSYRPLVRIFRSSSRLLFSTAVSKLNFRFGRPSFLRVFFNTQMIALYIVKL